MSKIKSILIALMCLVVCLAFAACGNNSAGNSESESTSISTIEPSGSDSVEEPDSSKESPKESEKESPKESEKESEPAVCEHNFVLKSETAPDCEHAGKKTLKCDKCGEEKTEEGEPALGHIFGDWEVVNAETCTVDGEKARYCTRDNCDGMETAKIPAAHKYALNSEAGVAPTCEAVGKDVYECSVCHDKYDEVIPALGHEENTDIARVVVEATCESAGYTTLTCKRCQKTYNIDEVDALGHNYEEGTTENATCENAGYTVMKCSRCDNSYRDITAEKLSHSFGDDGVCSLCNKSYLEANALFVSSEDNKAYAVRDEAYDYLIYAKDDSAYYTTITIDREIVDRLIANRYFKINFMLGNPDNCYRAMGYKLPGDENFRYVNVFQENGFGDNTKFELVIGDENGADDAVVTDEGIVLTFLYRYMGQNGATINAKDEAKYHGTLNRFALKMEYAYTPKPFDYEDKTTWLVTDYKVTYLGELSWKMNGAKYDDEKNVTINAETLTYLKSQGYGSISFTLSYAEGEKAIYYVNDKYYGIGNLENYLSGEIKLTDEACANGLTYKIHYVDLNHKDPAWGGTKDVEGFTFTLTLNKEFSLDDKETWTKSVYSIAYDETNARFEVTDGDPGKEQIEQDITLTAELLSAMKAQKMGSFVITMKCKPNQLSILGYQAPGAAFNYGAPGADLAGAEIVITDGMLENGYTFRGLYADQAQRVGSSDYEQSNGFYFTIEFYKEFDPETEAPISAGAEYEYADGIYTFNAADVRVKVLEKAIAYWMNNGYTSIDIIVMDKEGQRAGKNTKIEGVDNASNLNVQTVNVVLTEDMKTNGLSMILYWSDISSWAGGSAPDGIRLQIVAKN